jgi:hypothetical protein
MHLLMPPAAQQPTTATLAPGWLASLPSSPGPWLSRCCSRWGLSAPYDPSCSEAHWQDYYRERASLEWLEAAHEVGLVLVTPLCLHRCSQHGNVPSACSDC